MKQERERNSQQLYDEDNDKDEIAFEIKREKKIEMIGFHKRGERIFNRDQIICEAQRDFTYLGTHEI